MEWEGGGCWACFPPFPSPSSSLWVQSRRLPFWWVGEGDFSWWGSSVPLPSLPSLATLWPNLHLQSPSIAFLQLCLSGKKGLRVRAKLQYSEYEWYIHLLLERLENGLISFFLLLVCNYCALVAAETCTSSNFGSYDLLASGIWICIFLLLMKCHNHQLKRWGKNVSASLWKISCRKKASFVKPEEEEKEHDFFSPNWRRTWVWLPGLPVPFTLMSWTRVPTGKGDSDEV